MSSFLLVGQVDQERRQLAMRFYSSWYVMSSGVNVLAREIKLAMTMGVVEP